MKQKIFLFPLVVFAVICLAACDLEADKVPGDNDFEGFWHLERMEMLATDSTSEPVVQDLSNQRIFWSFQHKLLQLRDYDNGYSQYLCRFQIAGGKITITEAYYWKDANDHPITDGTLLKYYGIADLNTSFDYHISGSHMTLSNDSIKLNFKKF